MLTASPIKPSLAVVAGCEAIGPDAGASVLGPRTEHYDTFMTLGFSVLPNLSLCSLKAI